MWSPKGKGIVVQAVSFQHPHSQGVLTIFGLTVPHLLLPSHSISLISFPTWAFMGLQSLGIVKALIDSED
ncbi:hypothetical protein BS47DRAFT_1347868 [Hydnum rufescens UP504]|uniref:Uncharacterized protein n=1 Tax=Hydnum rufescens UP504 TaxID=1448309 RepID=A0A9P6DQZ3_9AGAM|nr:hypothetical protein BS47DRAFT_1347868 [Hydnum rufescens UP504]